jgi:hypothetical protein
MVKITLIQQLGQFHQYWSDKDEGSKDPHWVHVHLRWRTRFGGFVVANKALAMEWSTGYLPYEISLVIVQVKMPPTIALRPVNNLFFIINQRNALKSI